MIPSSRWFPTNLPARAVWYANFNAQFQIVAASLGLASDMTWVADDDSVMQMLADAAVQLNAFKEAMGQYREIITENAIGSPTPALPPMPEFGILIGDSSAL